MEVDQAIKTAIEFETRVRDAYARAAGGATDPAAKSVLDVLAGEEQGHLDYLHARLDEWKRTGRLTIEQIGTALPSKEKIREGVAGLKARMKMAPAERADAEATLHKALLAEEEVGSFYKRMVAEVREPERRMFDRFVEIEGGHLAIVQAELDSVTRLGFWFDVMEFRLDAG